MHALKAPMVLRISSKTRIGFTWVESDLSWLVKCAQQSAKVTAASTVLKIQGHGRVAKKLQVQLRVHGPLCAHHCPFYAGATMPACGCVWM